MTISEAGADVHPIGVMRQNLRAWNEVAPRHAEHNLETTKKRVSSGGAAYLDATFRSYLESLGIVGKTVVQFNCNNGRELLSVMQLGAGKGYGFDFSQNFIEQAREINAECGLNAEFVETNIYEIPREYEDIADVLFVTSGALCWMPDLKAYFDTVFRVLRPGGKLAIYETHPFVEMFKLDRDRPVDEPLLLHYPYFMDEPVKSSSGLDYYSTEKYGSEPVYWHHYNLSTIFQAVIRSGFSVTCFSEFEHDLDSGYGEARKFAVAPPMSYLLTADRVGR